MVSFGIHVCIVDQYNSEVTFGILADRYTCICLVTCGLFADVFEWLCVVTCGVFADVFEWLYLLCLCGYLWCIC